MSNERIENLLKLRDRSPNDPRLSLGLAMEYEKLGDWEGVARELRAYLDGTEDQGNAWGRLGHALRQLGRDAEAQAAYRQGIESATRHRHPSMAAEFEDILADW